MRIKEDVFPSRAIIGLLFAAVVMFAASRYDLIRFTNTEANAAATTQVRTAS